MGYLLLAGVMLLVCFTPHGLYVEKEGGRRSDELVSVVGDDELERGTRVGLRIVCAVA